MKIKKYWNSQFGLPLLPAALCLLAGCAPAWAQGRPSVVRVVQSESGYQLQRDGQPFFIKGAGGDGSKQMLAEAGGNSIRTWGADNLGPLLDEAQKRGLTVTVGIWLGHEEQGFNYNDADQVARQYEAARQAILKYKDHPAVLMWGIGNEMEGYGKGDNAAIWSAINNIATLAKKLDPNHPTMTVIAEVGGDKVKNLHRLCPDIDIVGINSYGGAPSLPERYKKAGGVKPYVLTEFGPPGVWESGKNAWGVAPEPTSTEKAAYYRKAYEQAVLAPKGLALGSYAFAWGNKQEATATWFGLLLPDGSRLGAVDTLTELWSGKPPANRSPILQSLKLQGADQVEPGATVKATLAASDPDGDPLKVRWILQRDEAAYGNNGAAEAVPPTYPDAILSSDLTQAQVRLPKDGGGYRLYAYVYDGHGNAAVGNLPLHVNGPVAAAKSRAAKLPLTLYDEGADNGLPYQPAGWMGNVKALKLDAECKEAPHSGKNCMRIDYQEKDGWGGIVWQSPAGDWGDKPGGWDLTGARHITFWVRGATGEEVLTFSYGLLARDKKFYDTASGKIENVKLSKTWQQVSLDLSGKDLTRIKTGFACILASKGAPITFYLDDIRFE